MSPAVSAEGDRRLTPSEVARLFGVNPKTVTRWAKKGKLTATRAGSMPNAHRRYSEAEVLALLGGES